MSTIPFAEKDVKNYLDKAIKAWRIKKIEAVSDEYKMLSGCYIDAFQSVRISLFGELLEKEE